MENSPALELGFKNFPMDQFGVKKPELKALAKTPEVHVLKKPNEVDDASSTIVAWLRNNIKGVDSKEEQSAYGLSSPKGVIVRSVWNGSPVAHEGGLKKGDVILEVEGSKMKDVKDFFTILKDKNQLEELVMVVMRNQSELSLSVKVK
jgi:S1-C subfamily serine protease